MAVTMLVKGQDELAHALAFFWHPVCTAAELAAAGPTPLPVTLLGVDLVVARVASGDLVALVDRCPHRSTRLSTGWVDEDLVRCAYHGWAFDAAGRCREIPSLPGGPIPERACVRAYDVVERYGLVWVRLDGRAGTSVPAHPAFEWAATGLGPVRILSGEPYTWPVSAPRRVENFVDLAHFAWVHDGTLGRRDQPVPPLPHIVRCSGELRFAYDPPELEVAPTALFGHSDYRMPMPLTVSIEFRLASGARRHLWMTASPIDMATCRCFWTVARDDDLDGDDGSHLDFQQLVLDQDRPVVCNQVPPEFLLEPGAEISVKTDRVSIAYRRWLAELVEAASSGPEALGRVLASTGSP